MEINIKGTIVSDEDAKIYEYYGVEYTSPKDITSALLKANGENVDICINSGGGDVFAASEIYAKIQKYSGNVQIHVIGLAASAASVIMCAANSDISITSMVMIHNVSSCTSGNFSEFAHESEILRQADKAICQAYVNKTGKSEIEMLTLMDKETWFTAKEAVELGLCDKIAGKETFTNACCTIINDLQRKQYQQIKANLQLSLEKLKEVKSIE